MNMEVTSHQIALATGILLVPTAQILLKLGANHKNGRGLIFLPQTLTGLGILWVVATLTAYAFQTVELKTAAAWTSLTYILVVIMSRLILREKQSLMRLVGCVLISVGILIFHSGSSFLPF